MAPYPIRSPHDEGPMIMGNRKGRDMSERLLVISADCHAGAPLYGYREYLPRHWHREFDAWAMSFSDPWVEVEERDLKFGVSSFDSRISWDSAYRQKV